MNWSWLKSKWFWINLLATLVNIGQYFLTNNLAPNYTALITTIIGVLQIIGNMIAGTTQSAQVNTLQTQTLLLKSQVETLKSQIKS